MYDTDAQVVLRCERCNKPFDKESTLKRHGYYCRSRRTGGTTRTRSCISCAEAKARCNNETPECARCLSKAIKCCYPANTVSTPGRRNKHRNNATNHPPPEVSSLIGDHLQSENGQEKGNESNMLFNTTPDIPDADFTDFGEGLLGTDVDFGDLWTSQMNTEGVNQYSPESTSLTDHSILSAAEKKYLPHALYYPDLSIQAMPTYTVRSFNYRSKLKTGAQRTANLILHTLKSYPLMMLRDQSLPPFIHPHLLSSDIENNDLEPLTNCISLVHMLSTRIHTSRKLFWKNVRMECERLCTEHQQLNRWELLTAMQALSIYILIRLDEGETDYNNFDSLMVKTVTAIATQFNNIDITKPQSALESNSLRQTWKDWVLRESARRLCFIYQVVNMLVYFEPAAMCDSQQTGLLLAPLPTKKLLWEASNEFVWKVESEREVGGLQTAFGLATNGDLVRVDGEQIAYGEAPVVPAKTLTSTIQTRNAANWEEWCAGMDGLGGLVMLAASLVS